MQAVALGTVLAPIWSPLARLGAWYSRFGAWGFGFWAFGLEFSQGLEPGVQTSSKVFPKLYQIVHIHLNTSPMPERHTLNCRNQGQAGWC